MSGSVANPRIWLNADVYTAPLATAGPADVTAAWAAAWKPLGLLSEDGLTESRDQTSTDHFAWGGILVRTVRSKFKRSFKVAALEDNATVWGLVNPGSTAATATALTTRQIHVPQSDPRSFGLHLIDGLVITRRIIARAEVVEVADTKLTDSDMAAYELTVNVYPDGTGLLYTEVTNDPQAVVA